MEECNKCSDGLLMEELVGMNGEKIFIPNGFCDCVRGKQREKEEKKEEQQEIKILQQAQERKEKLLKDIEDYSKRIKATKGGVYDTIGKLLIPCEYSNIDFDMKMFNKRVQEYIENNNYVFDPNEIKILQETLKEIKENIENGYKPNYSYLISTPNGFGKTTFANTCIKILDGNGFQCVPYGSLEEYTISWLEKNKLGLLNSKFKLQEEMSEELKEANSILNYKDIYDWRNLLKADVIFVQYVGGLNSEMELLGLKSLLLVRGMKNLSTIVFTDNPIDSIVNDRIARQIGIDNMISRIKQENKYDKLFALEIRNKLI